ncbi:MAG: hypothetical protein AAF642_01170 [Pseudomonadota bacterium]
MKNVLKAVMTGFLFLIGYLAIVNWFGSSVENDPKQLAREAYVTECMEARVGWRRGTNGFYNATTADERIRMKELCRIDFDNGRIGSVVQAVRDGQLKVRGQIDPRYHPELTQAE